ncbi:prolyl aminopeptidase [Dokdonella sp. MW10]|uniref:prolyl aminopeptidase n=1 Tax=Dokdonella sp. MW10 TaxID=2992926 RepID=UPI003F817C8F
MRTPYPDIAPWDEGVLDTADGHRVHYEQCGARDGVPVVFLHGGPGSGCSPAHRRFFDPARYRAVLFDQRGCGRSTPRGGTRHNTTAHLLADIEALRTRLRIERWLVAGGSWGSSLALAYADAHRASVTGLVLRGVFLTGRADLDWFFTGARELVPDAWEAFAATFPRRHRRDPLAVLVRVFEDDDAERVAACTRAWWAWERALLGVSGPAPVPDGDAIARAVDRYRVQAHYLARRCFLGERALLGAASRLRGLPVAIVHGREDLVCRPRNAWRVHRAAGGSRLRLVDGAGHDPFHPALYDAFTGALDAFAADGDFTRWPAA